MLDASGIFFVDAQDHKLASFQSAMADGRYDANTGRFLDEKTHVGVGMLTAVNNDLIRPYINAEEYLPNSTSIKELLAQGKDVSISLPNGRDIDLKKAVESGLLNPDTLLVVDPTTGAVSLKQANDFIDGANVLTDEQSLNSSSNDKQLTPLLHWVEDIEAIVSDGGCEFDDGKTR